MNAQAIAWLTNRSDLVWPEEPAEIAVLFCLESIDHVLATDPPPAPAIAAEVRQYAERLREVLRVWGVVSRGDGNDDEEPSGITVSTAPEDLEIP